MDVRIAHIDHLGITDGLAGGDFHALGDVVDRDGAIGGPQQHHAAGAIAVPVHDHHFGAVGFRREVGRRGHEGGNAERELIAGAGPVPGTVIVIIRTRHLEEELAIHPVQQFAGDGAGERRRVIADARAIHRRVHRHDTRGNLHAVANQRPHVTAGKHAAGHVGYEAGDNQAARQEVVGGEECAIHIEASVFRTLAVFIHHRDGHYVVGGRSLRQDLDVVNRDALVARRPVGERDLHIAMDIQIVIHVRINGGGIRRYGGDRADHNVIDEHIQTERAGFAIGPFVVKRERRATIAQGWPGQGALGTDRRRFAVQGLIPAGLGVSP